MILAWLLSMGAMAGYGDAVDGFPSPAERALHAWTNAMRMDPDAFASSYRCPIDGWPAGDRIPKAPLGLDLRLNQASRAHSEDMSARGYFAHNSPEGQSPFDRMERAGYRFVMAGENIQVGAPDARDAMLGWMCSAGHRENIMTEGFVELGPGEAPGRMGSYWTQKFGTPPGDARVPVLAMGAHEPRQGNVLLLANVGARSAPEAVYAVVEGTPIEMTVGSGVPERGTWRVTVERGSGCQAYWFEAHVGDRVARFPEDGAYTFGACAPSDLDDVGAGWMSQSRVQARFGSTTVTGPRGTGSDASGEGGEASALPWGADDADGSGGCGGADLTSGGRGSALGLTLAVLLGVRRRQAGAVASPGA